MAFTGQMLLTPQGLALLAGAQAGGSLTFVRFVLGSGVPEGEDIPVDILSPKAEIAVSNINLDGHGNVVVSGTFRNTEIAEGFAWRETALYATGGEIGDQIMYAYGHAADGETIPSSEDAGLVEKIIRFIARIDNAQNVSITVDGTVIGITMDQLNAALAGMMYRVSEVTVSVGAGGWVEDWDGLFRKQVTVAGMLPSRGLYVEMAEEFKGKVALVDVLRREGAMILLSEVAHEAAFDLQAFIFDVYPGSVGV